MEPAAKQRALNAIKGLPDDAGLDQIMDRLYALALFYGYPLEVLLGIEPYPRSGRLKPRPEQLAGDVEDRQN